MQDHEYLLDMDSRNVEWFLWPAFFLPVSGRGAPVVSTMDVVVRGAPQLPWPGLRELARSPWPSGREFDDVSGPATRDSDETRAVMRKVAWSASLRLAFRSGARSRPLRVPSAALVRAVVAGYGEARRRGADCVGVADLWLGLISDETSDAGELLHARGVDVAVLREWLRENQALTRTSKRWADVLDDLRIVGGLRFGPDQSAAPPRWFAPFRGLYWMRDRSRVGVALRREVVRQAVREGSTADTSIMLLAISGIDWHLNRASYAWPPEVAQANSGGSILSSLGATYPVLLATHRSRVFDGVEGPTRYPRGTRRAGDPMWSASAFASLASAKRLAGRRREPFGTSHLLSALADGAPAARRLLEACGISPGSVETLGRTTGSDT